MDGESGEGQFLAQPRPRGGLARQFCDPTGVGGHIVGHIMSVINAVPNRCAIGALDVGAHDDVLELGFGPGRALQRLAQLAHRGTVTGIDRSDVMMRQAKARNRQSISAGTIRLARASFEALPLADAAVDKILAVNVIYFFPPRGRALAEARRVLRPGGTMSIYATDFSARRELQFAGPETYQMFDRDSLGAFLEASAFAGDRIDVQKFRLPLGFHGLLARISKTAQ